MMIAPLDRPRLRQALRTKMRFPSIPKPLLQHRRKALERAANLVPKNARDGAASIHHKLLLRASMGPNLADLEDVQALGPRAWLERQLAWQEIDDFGLESVLVEAFPTLSMTPGERLLSYHDEPEIPFVELMLATFFRSLYSPRQLYERMVIFWTDHFNIDIFSDHGIWLKPTDDRDVVRRHALGTFPELLRASATSPAMLDYLTNDTNVREHPNENYARELMELHTLGVDGGYTEDDVKEVARCFTGWTFRGYDAGIKFGQFFYCAAQHDQGAKVVLGHPIPPGGGAQDVETVIDILAHHPSTARFISEKMVRYLWGYQPPASVVDRVVDVYQETGGDIPAMLRVALATGNLARSTSKLKRPYHQIISALRALFAEVENPVFLFESMLEAGHLPYNWGPPNGYPDSEGYWSGFILPRWNFATDLVGADSGIRVELPFLDPEIGVAQLQQILDLLLLGGTASEATAAAVRGFLAARPRTQASIREAIGLFLASPDFQRY